MYKFKHLGIQTASTNICERMGRSQELSEFLRGTVIGCYQSLQTSKLHMALRLAQEQFIESFVEWVSMAEQLHPSHTSPKRKALDAVV